MFNIKHDCILLTVFFITLMGFLVFLFTAGMSVFILWIRLFTDVAVPGWTSTLLPIYFLGGIQILCLGIIGEYLGKIYAESKARPRYLIEQIRRLQPTTKPATHKTSERAVR